MNTKRVAVLGAGIMGCCTALVLARRGVAVCLYDAAPVPFTGASRWNEGKIHLGFLYANDPTLKTAQGILPGGLAFARLLHELLDCQIECVTREDDIYLVHHDSVLDVEQTKAYFKEMASLIRRTARADDYFTDLTSARVRQLTTAELSRICEPGELAAGFSVPERSVATAWLAERFVDAVSAHPNIELRMNERVVSGKLAENDDHAKGEIRTESGSTESFDAIVNALWEGRALVDSTVGIQPCHRWTHRYRVSLFVRTATTLDVPSSVICTGPFGDVKNYNNRDFYLSWYADGLLATGENLAPPTIPKMNKQQLEQLTESVFQHLGRFLPRVGEIRDQASTIEVQGGWVFATGHGQLSDAKSTLHRRDRIGITRKGSWYSVDTGKYSIAPWLAVQLDAMIG